MQKKKLPPATQVINNVLFKRVKGYTQYYINESGGVWGVLECQFLKRYMSKATGYPYYYLHKYGKQYMVYVHIACAVAWVPNPNRLPVVNHLDCNKTNVCASNLEWSTVAENAAHAKAHGRYSR